MNAEPSRAAELSDEYMTVQHAAVSLGQERETLHQLTCALHAEFAAAAARYDCLLAEWQAVVAHSAASPADAAATCGELHAWAHASGDEMAALTVARRASGERNRRLRGNGSRNRLRVLRRRLDRVLFDPPPVSSQPSPAHDNREEITHFFHDMRDHLQMAVLAAAGLRRDLPPASIERCHRALERGLIGLIENLEALDPVEDRLPSRPMLTLVPSPTARTGTDRSHDG